MAYNVRNTEKRDFMENMEKPGKPVISMVPGFFYDMITVLF